MQEVLLRLCRCHRGTVEVTMPRGGAQHPLPGHPRVAKQKAGARLGAGCRTRSKPRPGAAARHPRRGQTDRGGLGVNHFPGQKWLWGNPPGARGQPRSPQPSPTTLPAPRYLESSSPSLRCVARSSSSRARRARASPAPRPQRPGHGARAARQQPSAGGLLMAETGQETPATTRRAPGGPHGAVPRPRLPPDGRRTSARTFEGRRADGAYEAGQETRGQPLHRHRSQAPPASRGLPRPRCVSPAPKTRSGLPATLLGLAASRGHGLVPAGSLGTGAQPCQRGQRGRRARPGAEARKREVEVGGGGSGSRRQRGNRGGSRGWASCLRRMGPCAPPAPSASSRSRRWTRSRSVLGGGRGWRCPPGHGFLPPSSGFGAGRTRGTAPRGTPGGREHSTKTGGERGRGCRRIARPTCT